MTARDITKALRGDWHRNFGLVPGPDHSRKDRSLKVWDGPLGEIYVHSFAADDWRVVMDWLRQLGLLPDWQGSKHYDPREIEQRRQQARACQRQ